MFDVGIWELALILVVALIFIGPAKLPDMAKSVGKGIRELRRAMAGFEDEVRNSMREDSPPAAGQESLPKPPEAAESEAKAAEPTEATEHASTEPAKATEPNSTEPAKATEPNSTEQAAPAAEATAAPEAPAAEDADPLHRVAAARPVAPPPPAPAAAETAAAEPKPSDAERNSG